MNSLVLLCLFEVIMSLLLCDNPLVMSVTVPNPTPPIFPSSFSISFKEVVFQDDNVLSSNDGNWYFDYKNRQARFDHDMGQYNNFCQGQGLSPHNPRGNCSLLFTPNGDLFVNYPEAGTCCRLCGKAEGCTILRPDWLRQGSKILYKELINNMICYGWGKHGAVAAYDVWYASYSGLPCRYHEVVMAIDHNITFDQSSFKTGHQSQSLFDIPKYCNNKCPHPYHPPK